MGRVLLLLAMASAVADPNGPENFRDVAPRVYSGGTPAAEDWRRLAELGIQTVVGVDGPPPNAAAASASGVRVVHVPLGYGEIDAKASAALTRVAREAPRPIYVYCHHGRHRGPTAAAVVCLAAGLLDQAGARDVLRRAGTDPKYVGLWRSVEAYRPPADGAELPPLLEAASAPPLALAMSRLDRAWEAWGDALPEERGRWRTVVEEALRESRRLAPAEMAAEFDQALETVTPGVRDRRAVEASCVRCHARHRDAEIEGAPAAP